MSYELYRNIYIISMIAAIIFLIMSIVLFIVLRVPAVIGFLSGSTQRKAIRDIKEQNEKKMDSDRNEVGGTRRNNTGRIIPRGNTSGLGIRTEKIATQSFNTVHFDKDNDEELTAVLSGSNETVLLPSSQNETVLLSASQNETMLLSDSKDETMLLASQQNIGQASVYNQNNAGMQMTGEGKEFSRVAQVVNDNFVVEYDITLIHTDIIVN